MSLLYQGFFCIIAAIVTAEAWQPSPTNIPWAFPLAFRGTLPTHRPTAVRFNDTSFTAYRDASRRIVVHSDVCPHMGARLSHGWISCRGTLHCPYHGFEFDGGRFVPHVHTDASSRKGKAVQLPVLPVAQRGGVEWLLSSPVDDPLAWMEPFLPPEHDDPGFRAIEGTVIVDTCADRLVENLLDMVHISFVHSFGNVKSLPLHVHYEALNSTSGRTTFVYTPNVNTISRRLGRVTSVTVENEFHLPTTTITRVKAGTTVKTVWTTTRPTDRGRCQLFWRVYRNFWIDPHFTGSSAIGDALLRWLMERTIREDQGILAIVDPTQPDDAPVLRTIYDVTILKYRQARRRWGLHWS
ncbi:hypothetical protein EBZ80_26420 [bacterium]|nr:hypothetical protein [bacterium]